MGTVNDDIRYIVRDCASLIGAGSTKSYLGKDTEASVMLVFLGDVILEAYSTVCNKLREKWRNPSLVSIAIGTGHTDITGLKYVCNKKFRYFTEDYDSRKKIVRAFENDKAFIKTLNTELDAMVKEIISGGTGRMAEKISVSVCCYAHDPINILLPDLVALIKNKLKEYYPAVDLFTLIDDSEDSPCAYAFFRELYYYTSETFSFSKNIMYSSGFYLDADVRGCLFDAVYLLGTENISQLMPIGQKLENYNLIALINYIKSALPRLYTGGIFRTAGYARVYKPDGLISNKLIYAFFEKIFGEMTGEASYGVNPEHVLPFSNYENIVQSVKVPNVDFADFLAIMPCASLENVGKHSRHEILQNIYGGNVHAFFEENIEAPYLQAVRNAAGTVLDIKKQLLDALSCGRINLAAVNEWLSVNGELTNSVINGLRYTKSRIDEIDKELDAVLQKRPKLLKKTYGALNETAALLIDTFSVVFKRELDKSREKAVIMLLEDVQARLVALRQEFLRPVSEINKIMDALRSVYLENAANAAHTNIEKYDDYITKIIEEYEMKKGENIVAAFCKSSGIYSLLADGGDSISALYTFFKSVFFDFSSIAKEVMAIPFDEDVLSRGAESELLNNLNDAAALNLNFLMPQDYSRYKIYLGANNSAFTAFAVNSDRNLYGGNCIFINEENRTDGVEKIELLIGVNLNDLRYLAACKDVYDEAIKIGHCYHTDNLTESGFLTDFDTLKYS